MDSMDFFQQHIQHVHSEQHQPFSRVQSTSTLVGCVESVDPQVFYAKVPLALTSYVHESWSLNFPLE